MTTNNTLPLVPLDRGDWKYTVAGDTLRIGRITATRAEWIEAINRLYPKIHCDYFGISSLCKGDAPTQNVRGYDICDVCRTAMRAAEAAWDSAN